MSCPFMLLKLYLDPLNFGRGYKRIYFLLERTNRTFQSHTDIYHLFFSVLSPQTCKDSYNVVFIRTTCGWHGCVKCPLLSRRWEGRRWVCPSFSKKSGHSMTFSPTPPYYLSLSLPCIMLKGRVSSLLQKASLEMVEDSLWQDGIVCRLTACVIFLRRTL